MQGFQPAFSPQGFTLPQHPDGEDYDPEEVERMTNAENAKQERMRSLFLKQEDESKLKQDMKQAGRQQLTQWDGERKKQIDQRRKTNKDSEEEYYANIKKMKATTNNWERIISHVEINQANYVGNCDVTRMRQAMIARKSDLTQSSGAKKPLF